MTRRRSWVRRTRRREDGATIVEAALIAPVFFLLLFGIVECGAFMFNRTAVGDAVAQAARAGSISGNDSDADYRLIQAAKATLPTGAFSVRYLIVFKAANGLDRMPSAECITSAEAGGTGVTGKCNVYQRSVLVNPNAADFGFDAATAPTKTADQNWPALQRSVSFGSGRDLVGVYVSAFYRGVSGALPSKVWAVSAVHQVEGQSV